MNLPRVWVNGQERTQISVFDRGLSYGDGFFTTALVDQGKWLNAEAHWWRIEQSCIKLALPPIDKDILLTQLQSSFALLGAEQDSLLVLKLVVTRGQGGRGYQPPEQCTPTVIIQWMESPVDLTLPESMLIRQCQTPLSMNAALAGIKHLNRLDNVLAKAELQASGFDDGLMENALQQVVCSSQANLFLLKDNRLLTPRLTQSGVHGTVRYALAKICADIGYQWQETDISWLQLQQADAIFLSNAIRGIMPVSAVEFAEDGLHNFATQHFSKIAEIAKHFQDYQQSTALDLHKMSDK